MHRNKLAVRILLIFSIAIVALAAPAVGRDIHQARVDLADVDAKGATAALLAARDEPNTSDTDDTDDTSDTGLSGPSRESTSSLPDSGSSEDGETKGYPASAPSSFRWPVKPAQPAKPAQPNQVQPVEPADPPKTGKLADASDAAKSVGKKFFTNELKDKMKDYVVLGAVAGAFSGIATSAGKDIQGEVSPNG